MHNPNLEQDLRNYAQSPSDKLLEDCLYQPLFQYASFIAKRHHATPRDYADGIVEDLVTDSLPVFCKYYNSKKGNAKAMMFIIMTQCFIKRKKKNYSDSKHLVYIENLEDCNALTQIEINKKELLEDSIYSIKNKLNKLNSKLDKSISSSIISSLEQHMLHASLTNTKQLASKHKCTEKKVRNVINKIKETTK